MSRDGVRTDVMAKIAKPEDVRYLAFEGGGGKGVTYLGVVRALEKLEILPIRPDRNRPEQGLQIRGVSGASAGAIMAITLALGMDAEELRSMLARQATFNGFFDDPTPGSYRIVGHDGRPGKAKPKTAPALQLARFAMRRNRDPLTARFGSIPDLLLKAFLTYLDVPDAAAAQLVRHRDEYLYNLLYDRGLFPGFTVREFFVDLIKTRLKLSAESAGRIGFAEFEQRTKVDIRITGTNVTQKIPVMFSSKTTGTFPVAEAVAISMNLPILFKPVRVDSPIRDRRPFASEPTLKRMDLEESILHPIDDLHGFWVDGGVLNNIPLHAFDELEPAISNEHPDLRPLNPYMLAFRLEHDEAAGEDEKAVQAIFAEWPPADGESMTLRQHAGDFFDALFFPSEGGQIRTQAERDQTIELETYKLSTTNFAPTEADSKRPIEEAYAKVLDYFPKETWPQPPGG